MIFFFLSHILVFCARTASYKFLTMAFGQTFYAVSTTTCIYYNRINISLATCALRFEMVFNLNNNIEKTGIVSDLACKSICGLSPKSCVDLHLGLVKNTNHNAVF